MEEEEQERTKKKKKKSSWVYYSDRDWLYKAKPLKKETERDRFEAWKSNEEREREQEIKRNKLNSVLCWVWQCVCVGENVKENIVLRKSYCILFH